MLWNTKYTLFIRIRSNNLIWRWQIERVNRSKIKDGKNDEEIYKFLSDRYGDFILLKPPLKLNTILLWFLPFVLFVIGILIIFYNNKKFKDL